MLVAHAPNIPRAPGRADLQAQVAQRHPAHGPDLAHALDLELGQDFPERDQAQAEHRLLVKLRARSARARAAADVASNSIPRPKKAR